MRTYVEHFIAEESRTDLDLEFPHYSNTEKDEHGDAVSNEVITPDDELSYAEAYVPSIAIDEVVEILANLKNKGADRVYVATHNDHHGYYFYGVKLAEETLEEYHLRMEVVEKRKTIMDAARYQEYLKLKKEFEV